MSDIKEYRERYDDARSSWADWRSRAQEDMRFSNPANPQQWSDDVLRARGRNRPALVFDQTNQYIAQVVNDARQNKPGIDVLPGDNDASDEAAEFYGGLIRQIEYVSRAQIAYDTGIENACRIGLGFILVVPEVVDGKLNEQEIRIKQVVDSLAATLDPDSIEPDGQDAEVGWLETTLSESQFKRRWPKAKAESYRGDSWFGDSGIRVCQQFEKIYKRQNKIVIADGSEYTEDEYWDKAQRDGVVAPVHSTYMASTPKVKWRWLSGCEVLEETDYFAPWIGLVPIYGNVVWLDGKRQVCGMTRRMMDGQRAYNYERSAYIESVALSPKAPWVAPAEAIAKYQDRWEASNRENAAVLPYEHLDSSGNPLPPPTRNAPPAIGSAYAENAAMALNDIQASLGMYKSSLGQNSNAKSGVAINKLQTEGDTATFHYIDNLSRSIEQVGRICVAGAPILLDRQKTQRILGIDGKPKSAVIRPDLPTAHAYEGDMMQVNPSMGLYDVRVKTGPSYTTQRQEVADRLAQITQGNPQLGAAVAPLLFTMSDMPEADKVSRIALALLPPEVQAAYEEDDKKPQIPPQLMAEMQQLQQQNQQLIAMLEKAGHDVDELTAKNESSYNEQVIKAYEAETKRIQALNSGMSPEAVQALVMQTLQQALNSPPPDPMPPGEIPIEQEPAYAGFFSPEQGEFPPAMDATGANPGLG